MVTKSSPSANGQPPRTRQEAARALTGRPLALDYRPNIALGLYYDDDGTEALWNFQFYFDIERMLRHPDILLPLSYYRAAIAHAKITITADSREIAKFAHDTYSRLWERSLSTVQEAYAYGWGGFEVCYEEEGDQLEFATLYPFWPLDCWALMHRGAYAGFSVKPGLGQNLRAGRGSTGSGDLRLWGAGQWPAKGFWYTHRRRFDRFYGQSQLWGAWRPWRRLATRDGAEDVTDQAIYRYGVGGTEVRYPGRDYRQAGGSTTDDGEYDEARQRARQLGEELKAGGNVALPGDKDETGDYLWKVDRPTQVLDVAPLAAREDALRQQMSRGIGTPPELLEASEVGSGWSGRAIPMLGFYTTQVDHARAIATAFKEQVVDPLIEWNYGRGHWHEVEIELDLPKALGQQQEQQGQGGGPPPGPGGGPAPENPEGGSSPFEMGGHVGPITLGWDRGKQVGTTKGGKPVFIYTGTGPDKGKRRKQHAPPGSRGKAKETATTATTAAAAQASPRKPMSQGQKEMLGAVAEKVADKLGEGVKRSVYRYTALNYQSINQALREGWERMLRGDDEVVADLDRFLAAVPPLKEPVLVYREMGFFGPEYDTWVEKIQQTAASGGLVELPGYTSASADPRYGARHDGLEILAGHGAYVAGLSRDPDEQEFLIPRGARFRVDSVRKEGGRQIVRLEQVEDATWQKKANAPASSPSPAPKSSASSARKERPVPHLLDRLGKAFFAARGPEKRALASVWEQLDVAPDTPGDDPAVEAQARDLLKKARARVGEGEAPHIDALLSEQGEPPAPPPPASPWQVKQALGDAWMLPVGKTGAYRLALLGMDAQAALEALGRLGWEGEQTSRAGLLIRPRAQTGPRVPPALHAALGHKFRSVGQLAKRSGLSREEVAAGLKALRQSGRLEIEGDKYRMRGG